MIVLCAGRHLARTAVSGWVILAAVALAIALTLVVEWMRGRWRQQGIRADEAVLRELDREFDGAEVGYGSLGGYRSDEGTGFRGSLLDEILDRRRGDHP